MVRHPYNKDPKGDRNLETYPAAALYFCYFGQTGGAPLSTPADAVAEACSAA